MILDDRCPFTGMTHETCEGGDLSIPEHVIWHVNKEISKGDLVVVANDRITREPLLIMRETWNSWL